MPTRIRFIVSFLLFAISISSNPSFGETLSPQKMRMAEGFYRDGLFGLAVRELEPFNPEGVDKGMICRYSRILGGSYHETGRHADALAPLSLVLKERCTLEEQESAYYYLGDSHLRNGNREEAKANFERLKYLYPQSSFIKPADERLGAILYAESSNLFDERQYKRAIKGFETVLSLKSAAVPLDELHAKIADAQYYLETYPLARKSYEKALELVKDGETKGRLRFQLASIDYHEKDYEGAIKGMELFLKEYPEHPLSGQGKNTILWALYRKGDFERAFDYLEGFQKAGSRATDREAKDLVGNASRAIVLGEYAEAIALLEAGLKRFGEDPLKGETMFLLAEAYRGAGREVLEEGAYREIVKRYPGTPFARKSLFSLGHIAFDKGLYRDAAGHFRTFVEKDPLGASSDDAHYYLAESLFRSGEIESARGEFIALLKNRRESPFAWRAALRVADLDAMTGNYLRAAGLYSEVLDRAPDAEREEILWKMAEAFRMGDDSKQALKSYGWYVKKYPEGAHVAAANSAIVDLNYLSGDYKKGVRLFAEVLKKGKKEDLSPENLLTLARGYIRIDDMENASLTLDKLISDYSRHEAAETACYLKGWISQKQSRLEEANRDYMDLLKKFPDTSLKEGVRWQIASNYYLLGDYKEALKTFKTFAADFPESHRDSEGMLRKSHAALKDFRGALESSTTFFELSPDKAVDLKQQCSEAVALYEVGSDDEAVRLSERIIDQFPSNGCSARLMVMAGEVLLKKGNREKAEAYFMRGEEFLRGDPLRNLAAFRLGEIAIKAGDFRVALMSLEKIVPYKKGEKENLKQVSIFIDPFRLVAMSYFYRGEAYANLNMTEQALASYRRLIDDFGDLKSLQAERLRAGLVFQQSKNYPEAIKAMEQIIAHDGETRLKAEAQYWIGECYQYSGDLERAIVEYLKVTYLYPEEGMWALTARYMAAETYQQTGQLENSIKLYRIVEKESSDKRKSEYARKKVEELTAKLAITGQVKGEKLP